MQLSETSTSSSCSWNHSIWSLAMRSDFFFQRQWKVELATFFSPLVKIFGRNLFIWFHLTLSLCFGVNYIDESATHTDLTVESAARVKGWEDEFTLTVCIDPLPPPPCHLHTPGHSNGFSSISIWTAALTNTFQPHGRNGSDSFKLWSICAFYFLPCFFTGYKMTEGFFFRLKSKFPSF